MQWNYQKNDTILKTYCEICSNKLNGIFAHVITNFTVPLVCIYGLEMTALDICIMYILIPELMNLPFPYSPARTKTFRSQNE